MRSNEEQPHIRASDIGTHVFCARALHLKDQGEPSRLIREQQAGIAHHEAHGARVRSAARVRRLSAWLIVAALALVALALVLAR